MWDFYLAGSEASFRNGGMMVIQLQLAKTLTATPITRDYMFAAEAAINATRRCRPNRCGSPANDFSIKQAAPRTLRG